jgi:hypothetical protein
MSRALIEAALSCLLRPEAGTRRQTETDRGYSMSGTRAGAGAVAGAGDWIGRASVVVDIRDTEGS